MSRKPKIKTRRQRPIPKSPKDMAAAALYEQSQADAARRAEADRRYAAPVRRRKDLEQALKYGPAPYTPDGRDDQLVREAIEAVRADIATLITRLDALVAQRQLAKHDEED